MTKEQKEAQKMIDEITKAQKKQEREVEAIQKKIKLIEADLKAMAKKHKVKLLVSGVDAKDNHFILEAEVKGNLERQGMISLAKEALN